MLILSICLTIVLFLITWSIPLWSLHFDANELIKATLLTLILTIAYLANYFAHKKYVKLASIIYPALIVIACCIFCTKDRFWPYLENSYCFMSGVYFLLWPCLLLAIFITLESMYELKGDNVLIAIYINRIIWLELLLHFAIPFLATLHFKYVIHIALAVIILELILTEEIFNNTGLLIKLTGLLGFYFILHNMMIDQRLYWFIGGMFSIYPLNLLILSTVKDLYTTIQYGAEVLPGNISEYRGKEFEELLQLFDKDKQADKNDKD